MLLPNVGTLPEGRVIFLLYVGTVPEESRVMLLTKVGTLRMLFECRVTLVWNSGCCLSVV